MEGTVSMDIDKDKCVGCGNCHAVCTMGVITLDADGKSVVNQDECVECSTCYRVLRDEREWAPFLRAVRKGLSLFRLGYLADPDICPTGALTPPKLEMPRLVRAEFSDPQLPHSSTGGTGRGTEEMKTNDVTGRLRRGEAGLVVELGRPGTGAWFRDIEKVAMALARLPIRFEEDNPVTYWMEDHKTGKMRPEILNEKVLSAIIEVTTKLENIPAFLQTLAKVQREVDTVISVGVASRCLPDGTLSHGAWVQKAGFTLVPTGKTSLGLGRPLFQED
jgi:ferredoxin